MASEHKSPCTFLIETLGCRLNRYESDGMAALLQASGWVPPCVDCSPDVVIVNTCSVTARADSRSRNLIRALHKRYPHARIYVTGCYSAASPEEAKAVEGVSALIPMHGKSAIASLVSTSPDSPASRQNPFDPFSFPPLPAVGRTRSQLKIQDGCDARCSYCIVPRARGMGRSRPVQQIYRDVQQMLQNGSQEIIFTGINIGDYRSDDVTDSSLSRLVENTLEMMEKMGRGRLRLSSLEVGAVDERMVDLMTHPRMCRFLHLPLQSGSTEILQAMNRSYTAEIFLKTTELLRSRNPNLFIGTDLMVGFPGETDRDFARTMDLSRLAHFEKIHVFRYSPREGTDAARLWKEKREVAGKIARFRSDALDRLWRIHHRQYVEKRMGEKRLAIVEKIPHNDQPGEATSDDYLSLLFHTDIEIKKGDLISLEIDNYRDDGMVEAISDRLSAER